MEQTDNSDLKQLIGKRGRIKKAILTRLKTFYDTRGETEPTASLREHTTTVPCYNDSRRFRAHNRDRCGHC